MWKHGNPTDSPVSAAMEVWNEKLLEGRPPFQPLWSSRQNATPSFARESVTWRRSEDVSNVAGRKPILTLTGCAIMSIGSPMRQHRWRQRNPALLWLLRCFHLYPAQLFKVVHHLLTPKIEPLNSQELLVVMLLQNSFSEKHSQTCSDLATGYNTVRH